jgi:hypothetical protein
MAGFVYSRSYRLKEELATDFSSPLSSEQPFISLYALYAR